MINQVGGVDRLYTYQEFFDLGDQWLIAYAGSSANTPIPTLFMIGHCLEAL